MKGDAYTFVAKANEFDFTNFLPSPSGADEPEDLYFSAFNGTETRPYSYVKADWTDVCERYSKYIRYQLLDLEYCGFTGIETPQNNENQVLTHLENIRRELSLLQEVVFRRSDDVLGQYVSSFDSPGLENFERLSEEIETGAVC